jgi:peptide/nickel transport system permease protein
VLVEREREYVAAARLRGERGIRIMVWEILPNITGPILVEATVRLAYAIFTAATLSFLGLGLQDPSPDWGLQIANGRAYMQVGWWMVIFPAAALATLVVGVNLVADGLKRVVEE